MGCEVRRIGEVVIAAMPRLRLRDREPVVARLPLPYERGAFARARSARVRDFLLLVGLLAALAGLFLGCASSPWPILTASSQAARVTLAEFETWDHGHERQLLAAHPECRTAACDGAVLAPYVARRDVVTASISNLAPVLAEAVRLLSAPKPDAKADASEAAKLTPLIAAVVREVAILQGAP